jgi:3'-phosphoadenosine 5'-phosphosulfate sulfotransferase (PAPS reductase)/FAD synthetase
MALMAEKGEIARPDCAIFADTGWEPKSVYAWLDWLESQLSYPVYRVSKGNIRDDLAYSYQHKQRFASIPFFTGNGGIVRRQCTNEYKVEPIGRKTRELLGLAKGERAKEHHATMMIGISTDEIQRLKPSRNKWQTNIWPLIDKGMSRSDCLSWMQKNDYPLPEKSSCIGCPYHSDAHWRDMRENDPESWQDACYVDEQLRANGLKAKLNELEYMHRSLKPLREAQLGDDRTVDMFNNECEGICGI